MATVTIPVEILIQYFKASGKFYAEETVVWDAQVIPLPSYCSYTVYMHDVVARVTGLRDSGTRGALPGLAGAGWEGSILVSCSNGAPYLIIPRPLFTQTPAEATPPGPETVKPLGVTWREGDRVYRRMRAVGAIRCGQYILGAGTVTRCGVRGTDNPTTRPAQGIAAEDAADGETVKVLVQGPDRGLRLPCRL